MEVRILYAIFGKMFHSFVIENKEFALAHKRLCGIET